MIPIIRKMSVTRTPGTDKTPMVRITNNLLTKTGFTLGTHIEVSYEQNIIIIKKLTHEHNS